jgi:hypothetical protein
VPTERIPLVGSLTNRNPNAALADTKDQQFVNCFPEIIKNPITGQSRAWLNKRQGTAASSDVSSGATGSYGAIIWTSNSGAVPPVVFSYLKTGGTNMQFFDTAGTQIGGDVGTTNSCLAMAETDISGTGNLTAVLTDSTSGANEAWFFPEGGAWTQITDGDFPSSICPSHDHMDGYMFVMTEAGKIYHSDVNSLSAWTSTSFISANSFADNGVGLVRHKNLILGFGDASGEFFYNAGNATGSVLSRIENATIRIGAVRNTSGRGPAMKAVGNTVYWIGVNADTGAKGIYRLNGMQPEKISSAYIDKLVSNGVIRSVVGGINLLGMSHIAFSSGSTSVWCYCLETGFWWLLTPAGSLTISAMASGSDSSAYSKSYFSTVTNAKIYTFNPNSPVWQDNSSAYTMTVQTDPMDLGTRKRKFWEAVSIIGDTQSSTSNVSISSSDDDYANFSTARDIDMSTTANRLTRWGSSRRRAWKLTNNSNTPCRLEAMDIEYEMGTV